MKRLLFELKLAYSTEIGAMRAYRGHAAATREPDVRADIEQIGADELHHRQQVGALLERFGARPWWWLEWTFRAIGRVIGLGCHVWGGWASAFGAAQFEFGGAGDYRRAARAARKLGDEPLARQLDLYQSQEEQHRRYFLALASWYWRRRQGPAPRLTQVASVPGEQA